MYQQDLHTLKAEVERILGRRILSASDCQLLSKDIFDLTQLKVSVNTLRRLFNLMSSKYQPSLFTLDVVAKYCGFNCFSDFTTRAKILTDKQPDEDSALLDFLVLLFKDSDAKAINDATYLNFVETTICHINLWPEIIDRFQCRISKTVNGQKFYFEQFINIDKLNGFYGAGLRYYLHEKRKPEAQIFGHSLLCLNGWLTMEPAVVERHYREIVRHNIDESVDPFICGRYYASQLFYLDMNGKNIDPVIDEAQDLYRSMSLLKPATSFPAFEYIMAESLVLLRQYDEALVYIQDAVRKRNSHVPSPLTAKLFETIYLLQATCLFHIGKIERARDIFETINTNNFYFLAKQYNTILYITLKRQLDKRSTEDRQLEYLTEQTGFKQLSQNLILLKEAS